MKVSYSPHRDKYKRSLDSYDIKATTNDGRTTVIGTAKKERGGFAFTPNEGCPIEPFSDRIMEGLKARIQEILERTQSP